MRTGRSLAVIALAAAALVTGTDKTGAQEQPPSTPPDLRMLLNLDLFRPQPADAGNGEPEQRSNASMLDQIRALKAMGYLRGNRMILHPRRAHRLSLAPGRRRQARRPTDFGGQR